MSKNKSKKDPNEIDRIYCYLNKETGQVLIDTKKNSELTPVFTLKSNPEIIKLIINIIDTTFVLNRLLDGRAKLQVNDDLLFSILEGDYERTLVHFQMHRNEPMNNLIHSNENDENNLKFNAFTFSMLGCTSNILKN